MMVKSPMIVSDIFASHRHDSNGKVSKVAEQDFLSGISLGTSLTRNSIDRGSKDSIRPSIAQAPLRESFTSRAEATPTKSIPITPRSAAAPRLANSYQSSSYSEDFSGAAHHEEEVGVHEATNLLFGAPEDSGSTAPILSTVITAKTFQTAPRKVVRHLADGRRVLFGFASSVHHHHHSPNSAKHTHSNHSSGGHHGSHEGYSAIAISSVLLGDRSSTTETAPTATLSVITHNPVMAQLRGDAPSDLSDDDVGELTRASHARSARHTIRLLNFKKKSVTSVSYATHIKPTSRANDSNNLVRSHLPPFRLPRDSLISSADRILRSASDNEPETPTKSKHSKKNLTQVVENSPARSAPSSARGLEHDHCHHHSSPDDSEPEPSSDLEKEIRAEVTKAIDNLVGELEPSSDSSSLAKVETAETPTAANIAQAIALDPYERCLIHYDPDFLDYDVEMPSKYLFTSRLPGFSSSVLTMKSAKSMRNDQNEAFRNRHSWLTTDLKLSKVRSVKRKLELAAIASSLDIACVAFAFVYFEKLILKNFVSNSTAKTLGATCLLLGAKFYGLKVSSYQPLIKELAQKMKIAPNMILAHEFYVFRKLKFTLFVEKEEVDSHFFKLLDSPLVRDKEFEVGTKERKKALKKQTGSGFIMPTHT